MKCKEIHRSFCYSNNVHCTFEFSVKKRKKKVRNGFRCYIKCFVNAMNGLWELGSAYLNMRYLVYTASCISWTSSSSIKVN